MGPKITKTTEEAIMKNLIRKTTMWSVLIVFGLLIGACGGGTENFVQGNGKIAVTVKNSAGTPLQNVQIDVFTDAARTHKVDTAVTDANGAHDFQETVGSDYFFTFTDLNTPARFTSPNNWPTKVTPLLTATVSLDVVLP
jgi:hypothetical protein